LSQTTFSKYIFDEIENILRTKLENIETADTLCGHTRKTQQAAVSSLRGSDAAVVIGGRGSSNSWRLFEACEKTGKPAVFIESADELDVRKLAGFSRITVCAGASTPPEHIDTVLAKIRNQFGK